ncbi:MAG: Sec-independent protein translocase protein TatB [Pseudomonadota bacterium]
MGGLGPGIGGLEILVIGLAALLVVGPKDLPVLMRKVGKVMAKARGMANEFRASFDEMARQSELDELRKEVDALRRGQGMYNLGPEADAAFKDISTDLNKPLDAPAPMQALTGPDEWPDTPPVDAPAPVKKTRKPAAPKAKAATAKAKAPARTKAEASIKTASGMRKPIRARKVEL